MEMEWQFRIRYCELCNALNLETKVYLAEPCQVDSKIYACKFSHHIFCLCTKLDASEGLHIEGIMKYSCYAQVSILIPLASWSLTLIVEVSIQDSFYKLTR